MKVKSLKSDKRMENYPKYAKHVSEEMGARNVAFNAGINLKQIQFYVYLFLVFAAKKLKGHKIQNQYQIKARSSIKDGESCISSHLY